MTTIRMVDPGQEMLDHVYFQTEPMEGAERGERLDFGKVERQDRSGPTWRLAPGDRATAERLRTRIAEVARRLGGPAPTATPPRYDREYFDALQVLDEEGAE